MAQLGSTNIYGNLDVTGTATSSSGFIGNVTGNVSGSSGSCTGNAATTSKLKTAVSLTTTDGTNTSTGVNFDGSAATSIKLPTTIKATFSGNLTGDVTGSVSGNAGTATKLKTARSLKITDDGTNTSTGVDFDGSDAVTLKLPSTIKATFSGNLTGDVTGNVSGSSGSCTGNAATATKATNDSADQQINTTYIKGLSVDGRTITYTKGDNSTDTITTQDTTYTVASGDNNGEIKITPSNGDAYNVAVTGLGSNAYSSTSYLPSAGGTITGQISKSNTSTSWVTGRNVAPFRTTAAASPGDSQYVPILSAKSYQGSWDLGPYTSNILHLSYITDSDFNSGSNKQTTDFTFTTNGTFSASWVWGAVFNDLADAIPVGEGDVLEAGYCYGFDGEHYTKTSEYMQKSYIGIHSDTYGFKMGHEEGKEKLNVAVSGFVLAYVDKEYEVGTPLTCTADGCLTEIKLEDKIKYPERIVATYWKNEPNEEWGPEGKKVKVNGRRWVKVK